MAKYFAGPGYKWRFARTPIDQAFIASCVDDGRTINTGTGNEFSLHAENLAKWACGETNFFLYLFNDSFPKEIVSDEEMERQARKNPASKGIKYRDAVHLLSVGLIFSNDDDVDIGFRVMSMHKMHTAKKLQIFGLPIEALNEWFVKPHSSGIHPDHTGNKHNVLTYLIMMSILTFGKVHGFPFRVRGELVIKDLNVIEEDVADATARSSMMNMSNSLKTKFSTVVDWLNFLATCTVDEYAAASEKAGMIEMHQHFKKIYFVPNLYNIEKRAENIEYAVIRYPDPELVEVLHANKDYKFGSHFDIDWTALRIDPDTGKKIYGIDPTRNIKYVLSFHSSNTEWINNNFV